MSKIYRIPHFQIDLGQPEYQLFVKPHNLFGGFTTVHISRFGLDESGAKICFPFSKIGEFRTALYEVETALEAARQDRIERMAIHTEED